MFIVRQFLQQTSTVYPLISYEDFQLSAPENIGNTGDLTHKKDSKGTLLSYV